MTSGITTVAQREAIEKIILQDDDDDEEEDVILPSIAATHPEFKHERLAVESDFYCYWVFLKPLACLDASNQLPNDQSTAPLAIFRTYGEEITVLQGLDLDLCSRWSAETDTPINMDSLFELCFVDDTEISIRAMGYFHSLQLRGISWLCSYGALLRILQTFGIATQLSTPCEEYNKENTVSDGAEDAQPRPRLYLCNDAARYMEHLLVSVRTSYENAPTVRYAPS